MNNDSAFPRAVNSNGAYGQVGMTLRDYFAAKAMNDLISGKFYSRMGKGGLVKVCDVAYQFADAMIKEKNKEK